MARHSGNALMLETTATLRDRHTWFGRAEIVEKPAHDLHAHAFSTGIFTVGKVQAGYVRQLAPWKGLRPGIGGFAALSLLPPDLEVQYDGRVVPGAGPLLSCSLDVTEGERPDPCAGVYPLSPFAA